MGCRPGPLAYLILVTYVSSVSLWLPNLLHSPAVLAGTDQHRSDPELFCARQRLARSASVFEGLSCTRVSRWAVTPALCSCVCKARALPVDLNVPACTRLAPCEDALREGCAADCVDGAAASAGNSGSRTFSSRPAALAERRFDVWTELPTLRLAQEPSQSGPGLVHAGAQTAARAAATDQLWQVRQQPVRSRWLLSSACALFAHATDPRKAGQVGRNWIASRGSSQAPLSLILVFSIGFHAILRGVMRCVAKVADKVIPFTKEPCYPYELASKNKPFGEFDGC